MTANSQLAGYTSQNIAEVESLFKALRVTLRPEDAGSLGAFSVSGVPAAVIAAGMSAGATIMSFRWGDTSRLALIKRVSFSAGNDATAFTAGTFSFALHIARSFTVSDSGAAGTVSRSLLPGSNQNKLRIAGQGSTLLTDFRIADTSAAGVTVGTRTLDTNPIGVICGSVVATAGSILVAPGATLFDVRPGEHPLVLAQDEGLVLRATVPATGTWKFGVKVDWTEISAY